MKERGEDEGEARKRESERRGTRQDAIMDELKREKGNRQGETDGKKAVEEVNEQARSRAAGVPHPGARALTHSHSPHLGRMSTCSLEDKSRENGGTGKNE